MCIFDVKLARNTQAMPQGEVLINPPSFILPDPNLYCTVAAARVTELYWPASEERTATP